MVTFYFCKSLFSQLKPVTSFTSTNLQVDDKYFYANDNKDDRVHGWVSTTNPPVGFWMIIPSDEFRTGGPYKQDLTSHVGPTVLSVSVELIKYDLFGIEAY